MKAFRQYFLRANYLTEETREEIYMVDLHEVVKGSGIANDDQCRNPCNAS